MRIKKEWEKRAKGLNKSSLAFLGPSVKRVSTKSSFLGNELFVNMTAENYKSRAFVRIFPRMRSRKSLN